MAWATAVVILFLVCDASAGWPPKCKEEMKKREDELRRSTEPNYGLTTRPTGRTTHPTDPTGPPDGDGHWGPTRPPGSPVVFQPNCLNPYENEIYAYHPDLNQDLCIDNCPRRQITLHKERFGKLNILDNETHYSEDFAFLIPPEGSSFIVNVTGIIDVLYMRSRRTFNDEGLLPNRLRAQGKLPTDGKEFIMKINPEDCGTPNEDHPGYCYITVRPWSNDITDGEVTIKARNVCCTAGGSGPETDPRRCL